MHDRRFAPCAVRWNGIEWCGWCGWFRSVSVVVWRATAQVRTIWVLALIGVRGGEVVVGWDVRGKD
jgi:hypothetical protein